MQQTENYLQHWGIEKGGKKQNHKYYMRVNSGNPKKPYIYFYSQAEYQAWLNKGDKNTPVKKRAQKKLNILERMKKLSNQVVDTFDKDRNGKLDPIDNIQKKQSQKKQAKEAAEKKEQQAKAERAKKAEKAGHDKEPANHKYVAKLMINGKYRYFYTQQELDSFYKNNSDFSDPAMQKFGLIKHAQTEEESQSEINKNYHVGKQKNGFDSEPGWSSNCYDCTLAYEARRRGYDVEAMYDTNGADGATQASFYEGVEQPFKKAGITGRGTAVERDASGKVTAYEPNPNSGWDYPKNNKQSGSKQLEDLSSELSDKYPDGARGNLCVMWKGGGGHSVAWEKKDGEVYIHDAQNNTTVKMSDYGKKDNIADVGGSVVALRTDDKKMTQKAADYLQPADNVDEAKGSRYAYNEKQIETYATAAAGKTISQEDYDDFKKAYNRINNMSYDTAMLSIYNEEDKKK